MRCLNRCLFEEIFAQVLSGPILCKYLLFFIELLAHCSVFSHCDYISRLKAIMAMRNIAILLVLSVISNSLGNDEFLQIPPIKMLNVRSVASRYPAANSTYRKNVENGYVSSDQSYSLSNDQ